MKVQDNVLIDKYFGRFTQSMIHYNLVIPGSSSPLTSHLKSAEDNENTEIPRTELRKSLLRRSSSEVSCYIIDHTPEFSDEHKNIVIEAWHFITDHISEVSRNGDRYHLYSNIAFVTLELYVFIIAWCHFHCRLEWVRLQNFSKYPLMLQTRSRFLKRRTKNFTIFCLSML